MLGTRRALVAGAFWSVAAAATAGPYDADMKTFFETSVRPWTGDPVVLNAVIAQNAKTAGHSQDDIDRLDREWRDQIGAASSPLIDRITGHPASEALRARLVDMRGAVTEIIVMDARGLNVATSSVPSDYWQGDEAKHRQTYGKGPNAIHLGEIEYDESSQKYQAQISFPLLDPETGTPIGAMTVAVDAEEFM
ncbi:hypothetical protein SAMN05444722_2143 [Rhodovulum sp. ES.010]|uniref:hypothetical protein n=1 Tax=Rhodovulum sp. ES.010 TaxID=1882821 RepID=UPI00092B8271|nr:hypothetical protein [Rhodovulum sp. ES.010]SIO43701.1 hypothetical protein SAMN05444722_2143 [Rhodovulum sp. ES.010]